MGRIIFIGAVAGGMIAAVSPLAALTIGAGVAALIVARVFSRRNAPPAW